MTRPTKPAAAPRCRAPLVVEFIGVTGAGKTTLLRAVREVLSGQEYRVREAHEALLGGWGLGGCRRLWGATLLVYLLAVPRFLRYAASRQGAQLARLAARVIARDTNGVAEAVRLAANFVRRIGVYLLLKELPRVDGWCDFILIDEGPVHSAHNLFVHAGPPPRSPEVSLFIGLIPKADLVVWVRAPQAQSVDCTLRRGHTRVDGTPAAATAFVDHAHTVFLVIGGDAGLQDRLLIVDNPAPGPDEEARAIRQRAQAIARFLTQFQSGPEGPAERGL